MALVEVVTPKYYSLDKLWRKVQDRLAKDAPAMTDLVPDSAGNYAAAIQRAAASGVRVLRVPSGTYTVGDCTLTTPVLFVGDGLEGIDPLGAVFVKPASSAFMFHFDGSTTRGLGGGFLRMHLRGETGSSTGDMVRVQSWSYFSLVDSAVNTFGGNALNLRDCMESRITGNLFRRIGAADGQVILIGAWVGNQNNNVNNLHIENNTFGFCTGAWIRSVANSNPDLIWINNNKFEWDNVPYGANTTPQYVIDLEQISRCWITHNGFTHFRPDAVHNLYAGCIRTGTTALGPLEISHNKAYACEGYYWNIQGGYVDAFSNDSNLGDAATGLTWDLSSTRACRIMPPALFSNNLNRTGGDALFGPGFTSHAYLRGTSNLSRVADAGASARVALQVPAGSEMRRYTLPKHLLGSCVKVLLRIYNPDASAKGITLSVAGTLSISGTVPAGPGWVDSEIFVGDTQTGTGDFRFINSSDVTLLLDGVTVSKATMLTVSFAWTPTPIAAGATLVSAAQFQPSSISRSPLGVGAPIFNGSTQGLIVSISNRSGYGNWEVLLYNPTGATVTPTFTRCSYVIFLG